VFLLKCTDFLAQANCKSVAMTTKEVGDPGDPADLARSCGTFYTDGDRTPRGREAAEVVLREVAAGRLDPAADFLWRRHGRVDVMIPVLHSAALGCSVEFVQRLLALNKCSPSSPTSDGEVPMHFAARSNDAVAMCKLFPVADLGTSTKAFKDDTPVRACLTRLSVGWLRLRGGPAARKASKAALELVQWMVDQPECRFIPKVTDLAYYFSSPWYQEGRAGYGFACAVESVIGAAGAARKRWTPLRAVWVGTVAAR
jgi:hypothetical protein